MKKLTILDSLRGFASVYVALGHWIIFSSTPLLINIVFRFGQEAVMIFFMLSGMVIFYADRNSNEISLRKYFIKRFRRIYFPLICAFIVSIIFVSHTFQIRELIGNLLMLQDLGSAKPGSIVNLFLGNSPLWSLSYEWVFYLMFPFVYPAIKNYDYRIHVVGIFCVINMVIYIIFPNHIFLVFSYFLIWWTGLELGEYFFRRPGKIQTKDLIGLLCCYSNCFVCQLHNLS